MTPCKKCGEDIIFVSTPAGKFIPCDPDLISIMLKPGVVAVTEDGRVLRGNKETEHTSVQGYVSHFSSCPFAGEFRR